VRAYVFRFALKLGHCSMHSACLKSATDGSRRYRSPRRRASTVELVPSDGAEWVDALNNKYVYIQPTHWRKWTERH
jgi:hypothetical protein